MLDDDKYFGEDKYAKEETRPQQQAEEFTPPAADIYVGMIGLTNSGKTTFVKTIDDVRGVRPRWDITPVGDHIFENEDDVPPVDQTYTSTNPTQVVFYEFQCNRVVQGVLVVGSQPIRQYTLCILDIQGGLTTPISANPSRAAAVYGQFYKNCDALIVFFPLYQLKAGGNWINDFAMHLKRVRAGLVSVHAAPKLTVFCVSQMDHEPYATWLDVERREELLRTKILNERLEEAVRLYTGKWRAVWRFVTALGYEDHGGAKSQPNLDQPNNLSVQHVKNPDAAPIGIRELVEEILDECTQPETIKFR